MKGAEYAFKKVTEAEPGYADGWLNVARALIQEGETDAAKPYIAQALKVDASLGRIYYFKALIEKTDGDYPGALKSLQTVIQKYPRDRVALNQMARELLLAQSSDWAFILKTGTHTAYAYQRVRDHLARFARLDGAIGQGALDDDLVSAMESADNLFPFLDYRVYGEPLA